MDVVLPELYRVSRVPGKKDKVDTSFSGLVGQTCTLFCQVV